MPTGGLRGQPVLPDEAHGQGHHAVGVACFGRTLFRGVRGKDLLTLGAAGLRIEQCNIAGLARNQVAHVVEHAGAGPLAQARLAALRARQMCEGASAAPDLRRRKIDRGRDTRGRIRAILSGPRHGNPLLDLASSAWTLRHLLSGIMPDFHAMVLKTRNFSELSWDSSPCCCYLFSHCKSDCRKIRCSSPRGKLAELRH